ncbi:hypothetical protein FHETE_8625 [Fusarium heterosporum]|uniref:2EXR domain-containing protein n=1 Tax=Fusarium heterosporum TaxID=42747 RepID=A0A8H5T1N7_FUSHE|nr:hypothetical protein FHETE_8625 [Fusarium heterosporum]
MDPSAPARSLFARVYDVVACPFQKLQSVFPRISGKLDVNFTTRDGRQMFSFKAEVGEPKAVGDARPHPATTFHRFIELPPEIRVLIWELSLQEPRVFRLGPGSGDMMIDLERRWVPIMVPHKPPAPARACRESQALFRAGAKQLFGMNEGVYKSLWFVPSRDIVYWDTDINDADTLLNFAPDYLNLQNVAVDWPGDNELELYCLLKEVFERFPDIARLIIVMTHIPLPSGDVKFTHIRDNDPMHIAFQDDWLDWDELRDLIEIWLPDDHNKINAQSIEGVEVSLVRD